MTPGRHPPTEPGIVGATLADGWRFGVVAGDAPGWVPVDELRSAMGLRPMGSVDWRLVVRGAPEAPAAAVASEAPPTSGNVGAQQRVVAFRPAPGGAGEMHCHLSWAGGQPSLATLQLRRLAIAVVKEAEGRGAMLLHGALVSHGGRGAILAGPSGAGKTTACRRLPGEWSVHSDDAVLVVPGPSGGILAHPWPTWSRARPGGSGPTWDVGLAVPLSAIFFLAKGRRLVLERLGPGAATGMTVQLAAHGAPDWDESPAADPAADRRAVGQRFRAACSLAEAVPAFRLDLDLDGAFWRRLAWGMAQGRRSKDPGEKHILAFRGGSMRPTLVSGDLVEVVPTPPRCLRRGDVVAYFRSDPRRLVVHRVVATGPGGLRTKGDAAAAHDSETVPGARVIGRVHQFYRRGRQRGLRGGRRGLAEGWARRLLSRLDRRIPRVLSGPYRAVSKALPTCIVPAGWRPRMVVFASGTKCQRRLLLRGGIVGEYDPTAGGWRVRRPLRLIAGRLLTTKGASGSPDAGGRGRAEVPGDRDRATMPRPGPAS